MYKVGDKVRVKTLEEIRAIGNPGGFQDSLSISYCGKSSTIYSTHNHSFYPGNGKRYYTLDLDRDFMFFEDELIPINPYPANFISLDICSQ